MIMYILLGCLAFALSAACGFLFIPKIMDFCQRKNLYDIPNERKVHKNNIPRLGGISFLPSMIIATFLALMMMTYGTNGEKIQITPWVVSFALGLLMIYIVGLVDDIIGLSARIKFTVQIIGATLLPLSYLWINNLYGFCGIYEIPYYIGMPLTIFILVFIMNAINLIDGIDGLSGSLCLLALAGFYYCFLREHVWIYTILIAGLMGVLIPFLHYNLFGDATKNKKIFMGDSGSLTLGYILGTLLVKFSMDNPHVMPYRKDSMLLAVTLLMIPIFDVLRVIIVRFTHKRPFFVADKNHIHHKLLRAGFSQHQALAIIIGFALFFIVLNIILYQLIPTTVIVVIDIACYVAFHYLLDHKIRLNGKEPFVTCKTTSKKQA